MKISEKNKDRLYGISLVFLLAAIAALLPIKITFQPKQNYWNEVLADVTSWAIEEAALSSTDTSNCPFPNIPPYTTNFIGVNNRRTRAFVNAALSTIRSQRTMRERIIKAAQLAIDCKIYFGSCGRSASSMYALAGIGDRRNNPPTENSSGCLYEDPMGCNLLLPVKRAEESNDLMGIRNDSIVKGWFCDAPLTIRQRNCVQPGMTNAAINNVYQTLERNVPEWPNRWADHFEPGDWLYIYVGNSTPTGAHSIIFLGWQDEEAGRAWIFEGRADEWPPDGYKGVRLNTMCLKSQCRPQNVVYPIIKVFAPPAD
jgi:hypothetical protein